MRRSFAASRLPGVALLLAVLALYLAGARGRMVLDVDEALYIAAGNGMARTGDLVTPFVNEVRFLDKPPMLYWLLAGLDRLLGASDSTAHLPPVVALVATTALLVWIGAQGGGLAGGRAAGAAFAFSVGSWLFTRETLPDGLLIAFASLALAVAVDFRLGRLAGLAAGAIFGAALAGGLLSKGLIGLLFPLATLGLAWLFDPAPRRPAARHVAVAAATLLALALPWHVAVARANPGVLRHAIVNEQLLRFFASREPADFASTPRVIFWALLLLWLLPWTTFVPAAVLQARATLRGRDARSVVVRTAAAWALVVLGFFTLSARLEHYAFCALPPLALLVGLALAAPPEAQPVVRAVRAGFRAASVLGGALLLAGLALALVGAWLGPSALGSGGPRPHSAYATDFGPLADLPADLRRQLLPIAAATLAGFGLSLLVARALDARGRRGAALVVLAAGAGCFSLMADHSLRACGDVVSSRRFGLALARAARPGDRFFLLGDFETANSIACYATQRIELVLGQAPTLAYGLSLKGAPRLSVSSAELVAAWAGPGRVFLLAGKDRLPSLGLSAPKVLAESEDRVLVSNRDGQGVLALPEQSPHAARGARRRSTAPA